MSLLNQMECFLSEKTNNIHNKILIEFNDETVHKNSLKYNLYLKDAGNNWHKTVSLIIQDRNNVRINYDGSETILQQEGFTIESILSLCVHALQLKNKDLFTPEIEKLTHIIHSLLIKRG